MIEWRFLKVPNAEKVLKTCTFRSWGLKATEVAQAQFETIRLTLGKIGTRVLELRLFFFFSSYGITIMRDISSSVAISVCAGTILTGCMKFSI